MNDSEYALYAFKSEFEFYSNPGAQGTLEQYKILKFQMKWLIAKGDWRVWFISSCLYIIMQDFNVKG